MTDVGRSCSGGGSSYGSLCHLRRSTYGGGGSSNSSEDDSGNCTSEDAFSCTRSDSVSSSSSSSSSSSGSSGEEGHRGSGSGGDRAVVKWWKMLRTVIRQVSGDRRRSPQRPVKTILRPPTMYKYVIGMSGLPCKVPVYPKYS